MIARAETVRTPNEHLDSGVYVYTEGDVTYLTNSDGITRSDYPQTIALDPNALQAFLDWIRQQPCTES